jgi:hypothetical protein
MYELATRLKEITDGISDKVSGEGGSEAVLSHEKMDDHFEVTEFHTRLLVLFCIYGESSVERTTIKDHGVRHKWPLAASSKEATFAFSGNLFTS